MFLFVLQGVSEVYVSITRIQNFLEYPELPETTTNGFKDQESNEQSEDQVAISMSNATCYWNEVREFSTKEKQKEEEDSSHGLIKALSNVSIDFRRGELTCIIGTVGCGKSALIQALVGELLVHSGKVKRSYEDYMA